MGEYHSIRTPLLNIDKFFEMINLIFKPEHAWSYLFLPGPGIVAATLRLQTLQSLEGTGRDSAVGCLQHVEPADKIKHDWSARASGCRQAKEGPRGVSRPGDQLGRR